MNTYDLKNFKQRLAELKAHIAAMESIDKDAWADISEQAQEDMVRATIMLRNMARSIKERYYDW